MGLMLLGHATSASASMVKPSRDRSDNTHYFEYDATSGQIPTESSGVVFRRNDQVSFMVFAREVEGAPEGERLSASFSLGLNKQVKRPVRYEGAFTFVVKDQLGMVAARLESHQLITLRPRRGKRQAGFSIPFDLPSGSYTARGSFTATAPN